MNKKLIDWWTGGTFSPRSLTPLMWFDSTGMVSDGSQWTDNMGTYNVTASGTARPTYTTNQLNGYPTFVFDGTTDDLQAARVTAMQGLSGLTMWMVAKRGTFSHDEGAGATYRTAITFFSDNTIYSHVGNGGLMMGSFAHSNNFAYIVYVFDGTQTGNANRLRVWVNGVQRTLSFTGTIPATTENNATTSLHIGRSAASFIAGSIAEVGVVASTISAGQITSLNNYLASRYAI